LARTYLSEYGQRVEITETAEEPKTVGCRIFYDTGGQKLEELLDFPVHPSMLQHERELEQANMNATQTDDLAPESISDAPPQTDPSWKSKTGNSF
jgi:hypothetical protein